MAYTTAELVQAELRAEDAFSGSTFPTLTQLETWLDEIDAEIDVKAGTSHSQLTSTEYIDYDGEDIITLKHSPVITLTSVKHNDGTLADPDWSDAKTEDTDYTVYKESGEIVPLAWTPKQKLKSIEVIYDHGYSDTPAHVTMLATKKAALRVLNSLLAKNVNERNDGGTISAGSISIVEPSSYGVGTYKALREEINQLENELVGTGKFGVYRYSTYGGRRA